MPFKFSFPFLKWCFSAKFCFVYQLLTLKCLELLFFFLPTFLKRVISEMCALFCWQPKEVHLWEFQNYLKCPSKTLKNFVWYNPSLLHLVICSLLPKHFYFGEKTSNSTASDPMFFCCLLHLFWTLAQINVVLPKTGKETLCTRHFYSPEVWDNFLMNFKKRTWE